jgi:hypothetical protein
MHRPDGKSSRENQRRKTVGILDGKVAIIIGGTSGIGARTVELFAR